MTKLEEARKVFKNWSNSPVCRIDEICEFKDLYEEACKEYQKERENLLTLLESKEKEIKFLYGLVRKQNNI